ncbi:MAG TPA: hypothetical protein VKD25_03850 [Burkholderiales bacterium]|nr:hypothetical protein [Burkholderiales bacterium]
MSKLLITVLAGTLALAASNPAAALTSKEELKVANDQADANYKMARQKCNAMSGNAKDVCVAEAKGEQRKAKARAEADHKGDQKSRYNLRVAMADADYEVAKEKCDARVGNEKDVCLKGARATHTRAKADARANRTSQEANADARDSRAEANRTSQEANSEATKRARDADYKVAVEKCDSLSGSAREQCIQQAKARFGRS